MILGGKYVARRPANVGTQCLEGFDEHGGLDGHVQTTGYLEPLERLLGAVFFTHSHQPGHFVFRKLHLFVTKIGKVRIGNLVGQ